MFSFTIPSSASFPFFFYFYFLFLLSLSLCLFFVIFITHLSCTGCCFWSPHLSYLSFHCIQSILSHQPRRLPTNSTPTSSPNLSSLNRANLIRRPPLLSIPQVRQPLNSSTSSSKSSESSTSICSPHSAKPISSSREKRRKLRSTRSRSPPSILPTSPNPSNGLDPRSKHKPLVPRGHEQDQSDSKADSDGDDMPLIPCQRLKLTHSMPPKPPTIPDHIVIPRSQFSYAHTPIVEPSYERSRKSLQDTYTCIRTSINPYSVSISSQPPVHFSKSISRLARFQKYNSSSPHESLQILLEAKKSEEQDKWWYWAKNCRITGDGNKSSHYPSLRCRDLKRHFEYSRDDDDDDHNHTTHPSKDLIQTRPISESAFEKQKFYYSGCMAP